MSGWRDVEPNQPVAEYAKRVCREIGWPFAGNLTLLCDCISSLAFMHATDGRGGFFILMEAVELAKQQGLSIDRWFFQDGRYNEVQPEEPPARKNVRPVAMPPIVTAQRKPN